MMEKPGIQHLNHVTHQEIKVNTASNKTYKYLSPYLQWEEIQFMTDPGQNAERRSKDCETLSKSNLKGILQNQ